MRAPFDLAMRDAGALGNECAVQSVAARIVRICRVTILPSVANSGTQSAIAVEHDVQIRRAGQGRAGGGLFTGNDAIYL